MEGWKIDFEIQRLINLKERQMKTWSEKQLTAKMVLMLLMPDDECLEEQNNLMNEYYKNSIIYINKKIKFFNCFKNNNEFPKNFIDTMNETMNDWLLSGWAYLGMEEHKQEAEAAKYEFQFYKTVISRGGVIQDKKKPTRRGGKKHRKN